MVGDRNESVSRAARVLHRLGLADLLGQVSARIPGTDQFAITPAPQRGGTPFNRLSGVDVVVASLESPRSSQSGLPPDVLMHAAVYRRRPDVQAIVHTHQPLATAFATARCPLLPIGHIEAELAMDGSAFWGQGEIADGPERAADLAETLGAHPILLLPCHGVLCVGRSLGEAVMRADHLEQLAQFNLIARGLGGSVQEVTRDAFAEISRQRAHPDRLAGYYDSLLASTSPGPARNPWPDSPELEKRLRERMELACHILYHFGLVAHREHVTHRLDAGHFLMTPRGHLGQMTGADVALLDMECNWLAGPLPPPPFMTFHRDILQARSDVQAIVHTHPVFGRILPITGTPLKAVHQVGAWQALSATPVYSRADMVFEAEPRRQVVALLDGHAVVHELHHGIDFVAPSLEQATVWAVHNEMLAQRQYLATLLGEPATLSSVANADGASPPEDIWWEYYVSILDSSARQHAPVIGGGKGQEAHSF